MNSQERKYFEFHQNTQSSSKHVENFPVSHRLFIEVDFGIQVSTQAQKTTKGRTVIHVRMAMLFRGLYGGRVLRSVFRSSKTQNLYRAGKFGIFLKSLSREKAIYDDSHFALLSLSLYRYRGEARNFSNPQGLYEGRKLYTTCTLLRSKVSEPIKAQSSEFVQVSEPST